MDISARAATMRHLLVSMIFGGGVLATLQAANAQPSTINQHISTQLVADPTDDGQWFEQKAQTDAFRFSVKATASGGDRYAVTAIRIRDGAGRLFQLIPNVAGQPVLGKVDSLLDVVDVNSDGRKDIVVPVADGGAGPNSTSFFYVYQPHQRKFKLDQTLSSLPQVSINSDHTLTSAFRNGCCSHGAQTYRYIGGQLTLVGSWDESLTPDGQTVETRVGTLRNGKMRYVVKRRKASDDN